MLSSHFKKKTHTHTHADVLRFSTSFMACTTRSA